MPLILTSSRLKGRYFDTGLQAERNFEGVIPHGSQQALADTLVAQGFIVKVENEEQVSWTYLFLTAGIPVMAHIGLTPQSSHVMGGFKTQGRDEDSWAAHEADAQAVSEAGAFAVVLEGMVEPLASKITRQIPIRWPGRTGQVRRWS